MIDFVALIKLSAWTSMWGLPKSKLDFMIQTWYRNVLSNYRITLHDGLQGPDQVEVYKDNYYIHSNQHLFFSEDLSQLVSKKMVLGLIQGITYQ